MAGCAAAPKERLCLVGELIKAGEFPMDLLEESAAGERLVRRREHGGRGGAAFGESA